jgi:hypothetical protein
MNPETIIQNKCLLDLSELPGVRVWRNNTGTLRDINGRPVKYGLVGSGDILGIRVVKITPDMVGKSIGQFLSVEIKVPGKTQSKNQEKFETMVLAHGGLYAVATSPEEAVQAVTDFLKGNDHDDRS